MGAETATRATFREIAVEFAKLGWLAFGGPVGQVGLMHLEVVERRKWIEEEEFLRALNFCHVLPGPEATQLAIYLGWKRRGIAGGVLAGILFILPGYLTLCALAWVYVHYGTTPQVLGILWGFRPVGLALLLAALVRISRAALEGAFAVVLALASFALFQFAGVSFIPVLLGAGVAMVLARRARTGMRLGALVPFAAPALTVTAASRILDVSWFFLKVGLVSFGGAYAVLPYLREGAVTTHHWLTDRQMIDALALGETTPGPLISIGIFVGYLAGQTAGVPLAAATAATFWLFLPSFVFVLAFAPFADRVLAIPGAKEFLSGVTAGVVGLMFAVSLPLARVAFAPNGAIDLLTLALGLAAFLVLTFWKGRLNVVAVVLAGGVLGLARALIASVP